MLKTLAEVQSALQYVLTRIYTHPPKNPEEMGLSTRAIFTVGLQDAFYFSVSYRGHLVITHVSVEKGVPTGTTTPGARKYRRRLLIAAVDEWLASRRAARFRSSPLPLDPDFLLTPVPDITSGGCVCLDVVGLLAPPWMLEHGGPKPDETPEEFEWRCQAMKHYLGNFAEDAIDSVRRKRA